MPVVVSMLNSYSGWAAAGIGFTLATRADHHRRAGRLVGRDPQLHHVQGMNRSFISVILGGFGGETRPRGRGAKRRARSSRARPTTRLHHEERLQGHHRPRLRHGRRPGPARAARNGRQLKKEGVEVKYAIHPVAGRMPGHMNVLLAEANVPYDEVFELEDINSRVRPGRRRLRHRRQRRHQPGRQDRQDLADLRHAGPRRREAKTVLFIKRGMAAGYAGVENELFFRDNTMMLFGDAKKMTEDIVKALCGCAIRVSGC
jgi:NAD(P) transhydrogenase subunit beta